MINGQSFEFILFQINLDLDSDYKGAFAQFRSTEVAEQKFKKYLQSLSMFGGKTAAVRVGDLEEFIAGIDTTYARQIISLYLRFT